NRRLEGFVFESVAKRVAARPAADQSLGAAPIDRRVFRVRLVLVDHLDQVVTRIGTLVVEQVDARGPAGVERIERVPEREGREAAVAVVGVAGREVPPRGTELSVAVFDGLRVAVDAGGESDADLRARTEEIQLLEFDSAGVLATLASETDSRVESPHVLRG